MYRQPVSLHELHPADDRTVGRVDLIDLHSLPVATGDMTQRAGRRIRSKTARMMLTFRHFEFKQRLKWKAWQRGTLVLDVNEAYTSKTRSWDGLVNSQLGGAKVIRDETGFGMDRDVNGARGIFCGLWETAPSCVACSRRLHCNKLPHRRLFVSKNLSDVVALQRCRRPARHNVGKQLPLHLAVQLAVSRQRSVTIALVSPATAMAILPLAR